MYPSASLSSISPVLIHHNDAQSPGTTKVGSQVVLGWILFLPAARQDTEMFSPLVSSGLGSSGSTWYDGADGLAPEASILVGSWMIVTLPTPRLRSLVENHLCPLPAQAYKVLSP